MYTYTYSLMSDTLITASWTHAFICDRLEWVKEWQLWKQSTQYVFKASAKASGDDTGESWYQFMKLAASNASYNVKLGQIWL